MKFSKEDAQKISGIIGCDDVTYHQDHYHLRIFNAEEKRELKLEVYPETALGESRGMLVVVYTGNSHLQLHNCSGYVTSEDLGEVTFVAETENRLSGLEATLSGDSMRRSQITTSGFSFSQSFSPSSPLAASMTSYSLERILK